MEKCIAVIGKARQILREIPQLLPMEVESQGNSHGPSKRFILGTFFLSWHSDIFIEGCDKAILETMVSQQNIAFSALDVLRKIENNGSRANINSKKELQVYIQIQTEVILTF